MNTTPKKYNSVFWIETHKIKPNPMQPRAEFNDAHLNDLAESIRQYGVLQPLVVTRKEIQAENGVFVEYELIAGERRLRASKIAGLNQVPVLIRDDVGEKIKLELAIIENLQREDLNPIERGRAFKKLIEEFKLKHHEVGKKVGKSREFVTNSVRLLALPEEIQIALIREDITEGHCRPLLMLSDRQEEQANLLKEIIERKLNVRQAENISRSIAKERARKTSDLIDPETRILEQKLSDTLGTRVIVEKNGEKRKIQIEFFSDEELQSFLEKMEGSYNQKEDHDNSLEEDMFPEESEKPEDEEELAENFTI